MTDNITQKVMNYMVPASSSPNAYLVREEFATGDFFQVNFSNMELNGIPFRPSGVLIDNNAGTTPLIVVVNELSFTMECPAGAFLQLPYPAPLNHTITISGGDAVATLVFVDYPVMPFSSSVAGATIPDPLPVTINASSQLDEANMYLNEIAADTGIIVAALNGISALLTARDTDGDPLPASWETLPRVYGYTGSDLTSESFTNGVDTWTMTYTYTGGNLTAQTGWVK